jgi:transcriptional regulator with XRE-family HTH domain
MTNDANEFAASRLKLLAEQMGDACGRPSFGWQAKVARRMGLSSSYVSRLLSGERVGVGLDAIERVVKNVPVDREYFAPKAANVGASLMEQARSFVLHRRNDASARALAETVLSDIAVRAALEVRAANGDATNLGLTLAALVMASGREPQPQPSATGPSGALPKLRVRAVTVPSPATAPRLPWPGAKGRYVGWRRATSADAEATRVRFTADGPEFVLLDVVEVPDSPYFQKAIQSGELHTRA